jgi:hypothetical protein
MTTTQLLLAADGFLALCFAAAIWDHRRIYSRSVQRFSSPNKAAPAATTNRSGAMTHGGKP